MYRMTIRQVIEIGDKYSFIIVRRDDNFCFAVNTRIFSLRKMAEKLSAKNIESESRFIGFRPCSFNEYISRKVPFL